jgi:glycosyltransferase involved in cell wall biosynthesis
MNKGTKKINLLVLIKEYPNGLAVSKKIQNLLYPLLSENININVLSLRSKVSQPSVEGYDNGIHYVNIGMGLELKLTNLHKIAAYFIQGLWLIRKNKRREDNNILFCIGALNIENLLFVFRAKLLGYKLIFDINEDYSLSEDKLKFISRFKVWTIRQLDTLTYRWATAIVVVSTYLRNKYMKLCDKIVLLIPVTAKENYNPDKIAFNNPINIIYAGSFDRKDGVNDIIEGFNSFNNEYPEARLILTGNSDQRNSYLEVYKDFPNIIFKGHLSEEEFYSLLRNADVMCMCRTNSGFSNAGFPFKLGEYLSTGNPVISTRASDVEDYLTADDAYLIDFNSPFQITSALKKIVSDPEKALKTGLNGRKKYLQYFSPEVNGKLLLDLLNTISSGQKN